MRVLNKSWQFVVYTLLIISTHNAICGANTILNIAVIGAGPAGLCAARHALEQGFNVTVYEQADSVGGVWRYTDETDENQYGLKIHSPMYQGLRTNSPNQAMAFPDHKYPEDVISYPPAADVLKFINSYTDRFQLRPFIKFNHQTTRILPLKNEKWEVTVTDLPNNRTETNVFDAVLVCNGHFFSPRYPKIDGAEFFQGKFIHSHNYRKPEPFQNESVLVIGGGASGTDIVTSIATTASHAVLSVRKRPTESLEEYRIRTSVVPPNVTLKENVKRFTKTGAIFSDGTHQTFSVVILATGYNYEYPFLNTAETGIAVDDNFVQPLYKQIINIEHPTMAFIGVPYSAPTSQLFDLQVRFALKFLSGAKKMPSKGEMLADMLARTQIQWLKGIKKHQMHVLGSEQKAYFDQLSHTANITNVPDVIVAIHLDNGKTATREPSEFRKYRYIIIDDKTFTKEKYEN